MCRIFSWNGWKQRRLLQSVIGNLVLKGTNLFKKLHVHVHNTLYRCNKMVTKEKTVKLSSLPEVLCIHVGRPPYT